MAADRDPDAADQTPDRTSRWRRWLAPTPPAARPTAVDVDAADRRTGAPAVRTDDYAGPDRRVRAQGSVGRRRADQRKGRRVDRHDVWLLIISVILLLGVNAIRNDEHRHAHEQRTTNRHLADNQRQLLAQQRQVRTLVLTTARNQQANTEALCAFRDNLRREVNATSTFLATHPLGLPGIAPAGALRVQVIGQRSTLRTLAPLQCPRPPRPPPPPNIAKLLRG